MPSGRAVGEATTRGPGPALPVSRPPLGKQDAGQPGRSSTRGIRATGHPPGPPAVPRSDRAGGLSSPWGPPLCGLRVFPRPGREQGPLTPEAGTEPRLGDVAIPLSHCPSPCVGLAPPPPLPILSSLRLCLPSCLVILSWGVSLKSLECALQ